MNATSVFELIEEFFGKRPTAPNNGSEPLRNLLQVACMGNAEKTIQGELLAFLRSKGVYAVSETGYRPPLAMPKPKDRHIDIMVFDNSSPVVAIELKHYSPHQGEITALCTGLNDDYEKSRNSGSKLPASVALIQIGLFTEVTTIDRNPHGAIYIDDFAFYRFLSVYPLRKGKALLPCRTGSFLNNQTDFATWLAQTGTRYSASSGLQQGPLDQFSIPASAGPNYDVLGHVHWFAGLCS